MLMLSNLEFWRTRIDPLWSRERRARVVAVIPEARDITTFVLAPNRWPGHRAGQFVPIDVEIDGVRTRRCYSISSGAAPRGARRIAITVKRVPGGKASNHLHDHVRVGSILGLGDPAGELVVPASPPKLALVAGGVGVTPIIAIVRDLRSRSLLRDVVVLHAARTDADAAFAAELAHVGAIAHRDDRHGHLTPQRLRALVPDLDDRVVYTCGPTPLMDVVAAATCNPVVREAFTSPPVVKDGAKVRVRLAVSQRTVELDGTGTLLEQLERAGERPAHGCRMGVCNTCRCTKRTGATTDLVTSTTSAEEDTTIRLCTSVAHSNLELAL